MQPSRSFNVRGFAPALPLALMALVTVVAAPRAVAAPAFSSFDIAGGRAVVAPVVPVSRPATLSFDLVRSAGVAACLPNASGDVRIISRGANQIMDVNVSGLPAESTFTVFVLQLPRGPFGLSWYQGVIQTDGDGEGHARFTGIFSDETFVVAPGITAAPLEHPADANANPATAPVHMLHLGLWFDSPAAALAAGCSGNQTPFNGDHTAGVQVLNTTNFPDGDGPIGQLGR